MNQENNNLNQSNFNTKGNNGIPNNQPLNNQNFNSPPQKKVNLGLIIGIVAVVVVVGIGIVFGSKLLSNNDNNSNLDSESNNKSNNLLDLKTYSNSNSNDNIAIPFNATTNGYYVIKIKENNIGSKLILSNKTFKNDCISISHYYRTNFTDGNIKISNLWNYNTITIGTGYSKLPEDSEFIDYEIIQNDNSNYLIYSKWKTSDLESYDIYIGNAEKDYFFKISSSESNSLDKSKELYEKFLNNSEVCYMNFDEKDNFLIATKSINNKTSVDISSWRFFPDMIMEYFINNGLIYKSSIQTENFNHESLGETTAYQIYELDGKFYKAGFTIRKISKNDYEKVIIEENRKASYTTKVYEGIKQIKLSAFDETFLYPLSNSANMFVKTANNYYKINTGITYNNGSNNEELTNKVIKIMNQIFN